MFLGKSLNSYSVSFHPGTCDGLASHTEGVAILMQLNHSTTSTMEQLTGPCKLARIRVIIIGIPSLKSLVFLVFVIIQSGSVEV